MEKKTLYMIGNSHIDPVWFWDWDEGMQEVKATFASALARLREYDEVKFTATSSAFYEWIEKTEPEMFEEIRRRVLEGRWELTGGWLVEPDCILPCGEAFVRQGLYAQRYFREKFGKMCRTGSNVDSFGHNPSLPQILNGCGLSEYVFMRPRLETPVFTWESEDGASVTAVSLPSEYTTWFYESTREAVGLAGAAARRADLNGMPCCYGVGNHGGGPTKANIEAVSRLREEMPQYRLEFAGFSDFFDSLTEVERARLPVKRAFFDGINTGCYSMDGSLKKANRLAENRLFTAEAALCMERLFSGKEPSDREEESRIRLLWKTLLFNQFHDTLGGTAGKQARDEALMQSGGVCAEAGKIRVLSMQRILKRLDTRGEGFPLILFNPEGKDYDGPFAAELNWFCKDGLILKDPEGREIPYQRVHTEAKVRNYNLGGRRGIVFDAHIPAGGFAVYRTLTGESGLCCDARAEEEVYLNGCVLENDKIRAVINGEGHLCSLYDKRQRYEALAGAVSFPVWTDERDTWGGEQGRPFCDSGERLRFVSLVMAEKGELRTIVRAVYAHGGSVLKQDYILWHNAGHLEVRSSLLWDKEWKMLKFGFPLNVDRPLVFQETAYAAAARRPENGQEYSMHRFVDVTADGAEGLLAANDGKYAFTLENGTLCFPLARSAIYAQGNGKNWYNPVEGYRYADIGEQEFTFYLMPHGNAQAAGTRYFLARLASGRLFYTTDCLHAGEKTQPIFEGISITEKNVELGAVKAAEEGGALIVRLFETEGKRTEGTLGVADRQIPYVINGYQILTLKLLPDGSARQVNMLEDEKEGAGWTEKNTI